MTIKLHGLEKEYYKDQEVMSLEEYLNKASKDKKYYLSPAERLLKAIGEPKIIDTSKVPRLSRMFSNRTIRTFDTFSDFYGVEDVIDKIVSYLEYSAQGLEERKQVLYLLGPVGGGKSSLAKRCRELMQQEPFYAIEGSPIFENPLGLLTLFPTLAKKMNIPKRYIPECVSPWLTKRLDEADGDLSKFRVVKLYPNQQRQIAISKTEPGDENTQDISALVGKVDITKLGRLSEDDPDAYRYNGALCLGNRGLMEFVEMFKAPLKLLNPFLDATQDGSYGATEALASLPFEGIIISHSNESEWETFRNNKQNEAFLDRIYVVKVPYCRSYSEEEKIYKQYISASSMQEAPVAPHTFDIMAKFAVLTRLEIPGDDLTQLFSKVKVYNGLPRSETSANAKSLEEYKDIASLAEGFSGLSTRTAFKLLSRTYNHDLQERGANPVHLIGLIHDYIKKEDLPEETKELWKTFMRELAANYREHLVQDLNAALLESYTEYGQNIFDRYLKYADAWVQDVDYRDPDSGELFDRSSLDEFLCEIEKPAGIANPKDFRNDVVNANLRHQARNEGKNISWTSDAKIKKVLQKKLFSNIDDLMPLISFTVKRSSNDQRNHDDFVKRMGERGYTPRQTRLVVEYYQRVKKSK